MARNVSDEELQLKKRARRRLVGAIVLVTTVAVVLPMILDSEPKPTTQEINIQIPSPDAGVPSSKTLPLQPAAKSPANAVAKAEAKAEVQSPQKSEAESETKPGTVTGQGQSSADQKKPEAAADVKTEVKKSTTAETKAPASAAAHSPARPDARKSADGAFVIQVAALSDAARAKELHAKIVAGGLKSYTEVVQTAKGPVTRVRVGPYASREAAEKARRQLQGLGLDGKVIPR